MQGGDDSGSNPNPNPKETSYHFDGPIRVSCLRYFQTLTLTLRKAPFLAKVCSYIFLLLSFRVSIFHCLLCKQGRFSRTYREFLVNRFLWIVCSDLAWCCLSSAALKSESEYLSLSCVLCKYCRGQGWYSVKACFSNIRSGRLKFSPSRAWELMLL